MIALDTFAFYLAAALVIAPSFLGLSLDPNFFWGLVLTIPLALLAIAGAASNRFLSIKFAPLWESFRHLEEGFVARHGPANDAELDWLAPGHGFLMGHPRQAFEKIIAHRLAREAKVVDALEVLGPADADTLLARVYADVPERMHPVALRSLTAHLLKLRDDGRAAETGGRWRAA